MLFSLILNLASCFGIHSNSIVGPCVNFIVSDGSDSSDGVIVPLEVFIVSDGSDSRC